jgi:SspJ family small acid-soluble spore protein
MGYVFNKAESKKPTERERNDKRAAVEKQMQRFKGHPVSKITQNYSTFK